MGLLGSALVDHARTAGLGVAATTHRSQPVAAHASVRWLPVELSTPGEASRLIESVQPRAVVNAAYLQSGPDLEQVTARAPGEMAAACRRLGARFVHVSSDIVFDGTAARPYVETDLVRPLHSYGRAKARSEQLVAAADPGAAIVRTSLLWGTNPVGPQGRLVSDPTVEFFTDEIRCPLRVDRLAGALIELGAADQVSGLLHVAGADAVDRLAFARLLAPLVGVAAHSLRGRTAGDQPDRPSDCRLNTGLAAEALATPLPGVLTDLGR